MKKFFTFAAYALLAVALPLTFTACGSDDDDEPETPSTPDPEDTWDPTTETPPHATALSGLRKGTDGKYYLLTHYEGIGKYGTYPYDITYNGQWVEYYGDYEWSASRLRSLTDDYQYNLNDKGQLTTIYHTWKDSDSEGYASYIISYGANGIAGYKYTQTSKSSDETRTYEYTYTYTWRDGDISKITRKGTWSSKYTDGRTYSGTYDDVRTYNYLTVENTDGRLYDEFLPGNFEALNWGMKGTKHQLKSRSYVDNTNSDNNQTRSYGLTHNAAGLLTQYKYHDSTNYEYTTNYSYTEYKKK
ncbi:MAG: hypothetical protein J6M53_09210 [Bacteroidaceae bacterium]|nr:hypothetical protein [Bacteroidaceae bacterium]